MFIPIHFLKIKGLINIIKAAAPLPLISGESRSGALFMGMQQMVAANQGGE